MDSSYAISTADEDITPWPRVVPAEHAEAAARHAAAVTNASAVVQRATAALATAQEHLRRAQDAQREAGERLSGKRDLSQGSGIPARPTATTSVDAG